MKTLFQPGDLVTCKFAEEIIQPMKVVGRNLWYHNMIVYYVSGVHKSRGNLVTVSLTENNLVAYSSNG